MTKEFNDFVIDTHTHYAHRWFDASRDDLMKEIYSKGIIRVVEAGISFSANQKIIELTERYDFLYAALGVHPKYVSDLDEEKFNQLRYMMDGNKILAVGETGLDYSCCKEDEEQRELQKKWFQEFLNLSLEKNMPIVIHCRDVERCYDAYHDLIEILSESRLLEKPGIIHSFSGDEVQAKKLMEMGFYLGVGGKFIRDGETMKSVVKTIPLDKIVLETDCPFLSPVPGEKKNTSLNLFRIMDELAKLKEVSREDIAAKTLENTYQLYPQLKGKKDDG